MTEARAVGLINAEGFEDKVRRLPNGDGRGRIVFEQDPDPGTRLAKGSIVTILVSTGKRNVSVPDVRGESQADAIEELTRRGLDPRVVGGQLRASPTAP